MAAQDGQLRQRAAPPIRGLLATASSNGHMLLLVIVSSILEGRNDC